MGFVKCSKCHKNKNDQGVNVPKQLIYSCILSSVIKRIDRKKIDRGGRYKGEKTHTEAKLIYMMKI